MRPPPAASPAETTQRDMSFGSVGSYFTLAIGLTWGVVPILIFFMDQIEAILGRVAARTAGSVWPGPRQASLVSCWSGDSTALGGLGSYWRRLTLWRTPLTWWAFLVVGTTAVAGVLLNRKAMLTRDEAVTEVPLPGTEGSPGATHALGVPSRAGANQLEAL